MGASQLFNKIKVDSSVHRYNVFFTNAIKKELEKEIQKGDILIVDAFILKAYESIFVDIRNDIISIQPTENEKSYSEIEKTINQVVAKGFRKKILGSLNFFFEPSFFKYFVFSFIAPP